MDDDSWHLGYHKKPRSLFADGLLKTNLKSPNNCFRKKNLKNTENLSD